MAAGFNSSPLHTKIEVRKQSDCTDAQGFCEQTQLAKPVLQPKKMNIALFTRNQPLPQPATLQLFHHESQSPCNSSLISASGRKTAKNGYPNGKSVHTALSCKRRPTLTLQDENRGQDRADRVMMNFRNEARIKIGNTSYRLASLLDQSMLNTT